MSDTVIIAEKKDQAEKYSKALGGSGRARGGSVDSPMGVICYTFGHILGVKEPRHTDPDVSWTDTSYWPKTDMKWDLMPNMGPHQKDPWGALKRFLPKAKTVIIATDPDREGELIGREIVDFFKLDNGNKKLLRVIAPKMQRRELQKAFENPDPYERWAGRQEAGKTRAIVDMMSGINMTVFATTKLKPASAGKKPWNTGRVKAPTLGLLVDRERAIRDFKPEEYFSIDADVTARNAQGAETKPFKMRYALSKEDGELLKDADKAQRIQKAAKDYKGPLAVEVKDEKRTPRPLFEKTDFLIAAGAIGFGNKEAERILQQLYQSNHVTYPRSSVRFIAKSDVAEAPRIMTGLAMYPKFKEAASKMVAPGAKDSGEFNVRYGAVVNDKAVDEASHPAIIPTTDVPKPGKLDPRSQAIYDMIATRYLQAFMPDGVDTVTRATLPVKAEGETFDFKTTGSTPKVLGWRALNRSGGKELDDEKEPSLPKLDTGDMAHVKAVRSETKVTEPPKRFTENTLLKKMQNIHNDIEDPDLKSVLKDTYGIGTASTRDTILPQLEAAGQVGRLKGKGKGTQLEATPIGIALIEALEKTADTLPKPETTALFEQRLAEIEKTSHNQAMELSSKLIKDAQKLVADDAARMSKFDASGIKLPDASERPASANQKKFARQLAKDNGITKLPNGALDNQASAKAFIDEQMAAKEAKRRAENIAAGRDPDAPAPASDKQIKMLKGLHPTVPKDSALGKMDPDNAEQWATLSAKKASELIDYGMKNSSQNGPVLIGEISPKQAQFVRKIIDKAPKDAEFAAPFMLDGKVNEEAIKKMSKQDASNFLDAHADKLPNRGGRNNAGSVAPKMARARKKAPRRGGYSM